MNNVTLSLSVHNITIARGFDDTIAAFTYMVALISFLENIVILLFLFKLLATLSTGNEQCEFIKQLLFVSSIDTVSSFTLFWIGIIRVSDHASALICAILANLTTTFQYMSLGNFTCICTFRYHIARNLRKHGGVQKSRLNLILVLANSLCLFLGVISFLATVKLRTIPKGTSVTCDYISTVTERARDMIGQLFLVVSIGFTLLSDIMCILTAVRLNKEMSVVSDGVSSTASSTEARNSSKVTQRRAICTLAVINLFFNLSILPVVCVFALVFAGVITSPKVGRIVFVSMFLNSMFNPIIIIVRFREIRRLIWQFVAAFKMRFM